jgi:hypothetical protein
LTVNLSQRMAMMFYSCLLIYFDSTGKLKITNILA